MGKDKALSDEKHGRIKGIHEASVIMRAIARAFKRSLAAVNRVMNSRVLQQAAAMPPVLSDSAIRLLVRTVAR